MHDLSHIGGGVLAGGGATREKEAARVMRYYQEMWHPDKGFLRIFKHRIAPAEREEIEKRAMDVSAELGVAKQFYKEAKEKREEKEAKSGKAKTGEEEIADENNLVKTPTTTREKEVEEQPLEQAESHELD